MLDRPLGDRRGDTEPFAELAVGDESELSVGWIAVLVAEARRAGGTKAVSI